MGMFDYVKINKKFLPESIREIKAEWQTKNHDKLLNLLTIEEDGKLYIDNTVDNLVKQGERKFLAYTGEIRFYDSIDNVWWEFVAFFEQGNLLKCIQLKPE